MPAGLQRAGRHPLDCYAYSGSEDNVDTDRSIPASPKELVAQVYGDIARLGSGSAQTGSGPQRWGYSEDQQSTIIPQADLGLSCGNPLPHAPLGEGDVVLDLGCGAGFDSLIAARLVGPEGRVSVSISPPRWSSVPGSMPPPPDMAMSNSRPVTSRRCRLKQQY